MEGSELHGKVLKCSFARPQTKLTPGKAVWAVEEFLKGTVSDSIQYEESS